MRKSVALIVAAGLLVALAGCASPSGGSASGCTPSVGPGQASDLVTASTDPANPAGTFGTPPTVGVSFPVSPDTTQVTTLIDGTGPTLTTGGVVSLDYILADGTTGQVATNGTPFDGSSYLIAPVSGINLPGLRSALECRTTGSRLAIAIPPAEQVDPASTTSGAPSDTLVLIVDIRGALPSRADGAIQPAKAGLPSVALAPDGRPGITIPSGDVPTTASSTALKKGDGQVVAQGDGVWVQYTAVSWTSKSVTDSTWADGAPVQVAAASDGSSKVPDLVGQTVGSQYISVVPPTASGGTTAGGPTVYVVDVLGITPVVASNQNQ